MSKVQVLKRLEITFGASAEPVAEILLQQELYSASFKGISLNSTPEDILVCRVGAKISFEKKQEDKLQSFLPCLIDHAELLDAQLAVLQESGTDDSGGIQLLHAEFKLRQLLLLAHYQDYSDEAGRRRMVETLRRIIVFDDLAPENLCLCSKGLLPACGVDEFERTVAEIITEIEDMTTEQPASMSGGVDWKDLAFLQALEIIRAYLEVLPQGTRRSSSFDYILHRFVLPAVRSANATLRTAGINCLSLACSSDKTLANENHALYLHLIQNKSKELQKISLQTVFDLTMLHGEQIFGLDTIVQIIKFGLGSSDPDVLTLIVEGSCKLIICKAVDDHEILEALAILLFHPGTRGHQRLRQCLSFFFPLFLLSSNANQCTFSKVVPACLMSLISAYEDVETEDGLTLALIAGQLFEWTDWRHLERLQPGDAMTADTDINKNLHADIGIDLISKLQTRPAILKEGAKLLSLLSLDKEVSHASLERLLDAAQDLVEHQSPDAPTLKLLGRFTDKLEALL
ncbi:nuclear condensing complex subunit [Zopfochytrium polystomum]|nr:nuclear condensing complex subunit [Zopfochytrium polystomum]